MRELETNILFLSVRNDRDLNVKFIELKSTQFKNIFTGGKNSANRGYT